MIPADFNYHKAKSLDEAIALLQQHGDEGKLLAGGQSLIPAMRFRLAMPATLIDISGLDELRYVREENGYLAIGAMTCETAIEESALVGRAYPLLLDTAKVIADPLVRNRATIGGNLAHADPANDHPAAMLAYGAEMVAKGPKGVRTIPVDGFFTGLFENALQAGEILAEIRIPRPVDYGGGAYVKMERKVGDYAVAAVAVNLVLAGDTVQSIRIGLTNVSAVPMRAANAEQVLSGGKLTDALLEDAGRAASQECDPSGDLRGSVEYKRDVTRILMKRAVLRAAERARGN